MGQELPDPAPWIADLPLDARGFPVPAEAGWEAGVPILSKVAADRKLALGLRRACAVCGYTMRRGNNVFRAFAQGDAAHMRQYERERSHDLGGPLHLSCVLYSAMVCPYLREKNARLGKASDINPGARRGTRAAIMGFQDFGILLPAGLPNAAVQPTQHFAYMRLSDDIGYRDGSELADRYAAAVEADASRIDVSRPRLFWTDAEGDSVALKRALDEGGRHIKKIRPAYEQVIQGVGVFVALPM